LDSQYERKLMSKKSAALLAAIKEYDANKWKAIGQKVGKPAKVRFNLRLRSDVSMSISS
jgi:hypothetical protein